MPLFQYTDKSTCSPSGLFNGTVLAEIEEDTILTADKVFQELLNINPTRGMIAVSILKEWSFSLNQTIDIESGMGLL